MGELRDALRKNHIEVLLIDPLYLCLLGGGTAGPNSANLYEMGPLLLRVAQTCLSIGCTPVLLHHFKITRRDPLDEPQLDDLAFAGIQEFARQWVLLGRREKFVPGSGQHDLWLTVGGSAGHSGCWALHIEKGTITDSGIFTGRRWDVTLTTAGEARTTKANEREADKSRYRQQQDKKDDDALLNALDRLMGQAPGARGISYQQVKVESRLSDGRMSRATDRLVAAEIIERVDVLVKIGNGATRKAVGLRRKPEPED
jgi:hypothetical protein